MFKSLSVLASVLGFVILFSIQSATGADPEWREKQEALFKQIDLKYGDVIEKADANKIDGLVPPQILGWLKKGYMVNMRIGEFKYDVEADDKWMNASRKNEGKFKIGSAGNVVEVATGKAPSWVYGVPFPDFDLKNDPDGPLKFMYNRQVCQMRGRTMTADFSLEWIGRKGFERSVQCLWTEYMFWGSDKPEPNPGKHRYLFINSVTKPYDLAGIAQLTYRKLSGSSDDFYVFIPAIRRVKKMSGANRSDPYVGSDLTIDDGGGFAGQQNSMKWRFIEEKVGLMSVEEPDTMSTSKLSQTSDGTWRIKLDYEDAMRVGWQEKGWKGAPWAPVRAVWVPRVLEIIEGTPIDPYYNSGKTVYWVDKVTYHTAFKIIWDRAGEYWKSIVFHPRCLEWAGRKAYHGGGASGYVVFDEKLNHATAVRIGPGHLWLDDPKLTPQMFTVENLRTMGK